ncbi:hypothetical protein VTI28DRAFT_4328 [Corynascus sepedonium]
MGWFWQSPSSAKATDSNDASSSTSTSPVPPPAAPQGQAPAAGAATSSSDREMAMFMDMLLKDAQSSSAQPKTQPPPPIRTPPMSSEPKSTSSSWFPWSSTKSTTATAEPTPEQTQQPASIKTRSPQSVAMSEHVLPTTMSCRDAFDYAWHCHTPGAQWNAVYRYGSVRPCTELWDDFWFCMRTKSYSPELRAEAIREHYRAKEEAKYGAGRPSSEDVWESRDERVAPGTAFKKSFDPPIVDDAEFQRADAERRRRIREMIGVEGR